MSEYRQHPKSHGASWCVASSLLDDRYAFEFISCESIRRNKFLKTIRYQSIEMSMEIKEIYDFHNIRDSRKDSLFHRKSFKNKKS